MDQEYALIEKQLSSRVEFDGRILHVLNDEIELPNGEISTREYIRHLGAVCIVAVTDEGNVVMERQYRYPMGRVVFEIPAGKLDSPEEDRLKAAKRELGEETGITADHWISLGNYMPAPAYSSEDITMYLATGLHRGERHLDQDEFLEVCEVPMQNLVADILAGKITDGKTQIAILKADALLKEKK